VKVCLAQVEPGTPFPRLRELLEPEGAAVYALPEYLTAAPGEVEQAQTAAHFRRDLEALTRLSRALGGLLLGGTLVEPASGGFYNSAPVLEDGELVGFHRKVHPTPRERSHGVLPGGGFVGSPTSAGRVTVLICADVLAGSSFSQAARERPDILFVPTTSPLRPGEPREEKERRDRTIFLAGARAAGAFVIKVCATGSVYGRPLQGRSLVAAPWGEFLVRVPPDGEAHETILSVELDFEGLQRWRAGGGPSAGEPRGGRGTAGRVPR
jgi:predicted amidohydrolase